MSGNKYKNVDDLNFGTVILSGYLKKLKTSKRKYFVLRAETYDTSACLEYYDSQKKFNSNQPPKRTIPLKTCFNINKRSDTKHKHVIALYTKDDCFCVILDSEEVLEAWLKALLSQQQGEDAPDGETPRPTFEHVWQVTVLKRGLGAAPFRGGVISGHLPVFRLCLTDKTLSLIKNDWDTPHVELSLSHIRSCGSLKNYFFLETGRYSSIGTGELWMETEDANIAHNVHQTVYFAMTSNKASREDIVPKGRNRSCSYTESSKPNRRQTHSGTKPVIPPLQDNTQSISTNEVQMHPTTSSSSIITQTGVNGGHHPASAFPPTPTVSVSVSHQRTRSLPLSNPAPFTTDYHHHHNHHNLTTHHHHPPPPPRAAKRPNQSARCISTDGRIRSDSMPSRPRTTSEGGATNHHHPPHPSHPHHFAYTSTRPNNNNPSSHYTPITLITTCGGTTTTSTSSRPPSMHIYRSDMLSHSPPNSGGSPVSPPSATCSTTDSAGSSLSIDEGGGGGVTSLGGYGEGNITGMISNSCWQDGDGALGRYGHSLTPDEAIAEENCDECCCADASCNVHGTGSSYMVMAPPSSDDGYVDMSPKGTTNRGGNSSGVHNMSPAMSMCSITSGTPSTDLRFAEYPLEKVSAYLTPSEEDETSSTDRPMRAYSVGSRPETLKYRNRVDTGRSSCNSSSAAAENSRVRAFSVGAKTKKGFSRVLPPHGNSTVYSHPGVKSSSAPILSTSRGPGAHSSHSSIDHPMDDLMEMDFSKPCSGYMDMKPGKQATTPTNSSSTPSSGYVEMRPGHGTTPTNSNPDTAAARNADISSYLDMKPGSSPAKPTYIPLHDSPRYHLAASSSSTGSSSSRGNSTEYMDMRQKYGAQKLSTSPLVNSSPITQQGTDYMDMSFTPKNQQQQSNRNDRHSFSSTTSGGGGDQYSASPVKSISSPMGSPVEYMSMDYSHSRSGSDSKPQFYQPTTPQQQPVEGYVEMTLGRGSSNHQRQSSGDSLSGGRSNNNMKPGTRERKNSKRDKNRSQPIMIQQSSGNSSQLTDPSPGSPGYVALRKYSTGTSPCATSNSMHLPLSTNSGTTTYPSLPRQQRSRKNSSRRESSRDSSTSSVTTPSSSSTMFPISLNSPCSPVKPHHTVIKVPKAVLQAKYDQSSTGFGSTNQAVVDDYTMMDFENRVPQPQHKPPKDTEDSSDYVNYNPAKSKESNTGTYATTSMRGTSSECGDYAIMKPGVLLSRLIGDSSVDSNCCFRPIIDEVLYKTAAANVSQPSVNCATNNNKVCVDFTNIKQRPSSVNEKQPAAASSSSSSPRLSFGSSNSSEDRPSSETRSTILLNSRPSSTSSELSSSTSTLVSSRPGSVNSDKVVPTLHYAKLDLSGGTVSETPASESSLTTRNIAVTSLNQSVKSSVVEGGSGSGGGEPQTTAGFTYAKIDFIKSEGFKQQQQQCPVAMTGATSKITQH